MVYFFHRYELPILTSQHVRRHFGHRNSGNPSPPSRLNEEADNNPSQDPSTDQFNSGEPLSESNASNSSSDNVSTDHNNPSGDNSVEQVNSSDDSSVQQIDTASLLITEASVKNPSSRVSSAHNKDEISYHIPNMVVAVQNLKPNSKPKTGLNIIILSIKENIEIILMNFKSYLILFFILLLCSRTLISVLNIFLTKLYPYEDLRIIES